MKRLFSAYTPADEGALQWLKSMLEGAAIACLVRNESLGVAKGDIPASECVPELWILDDHDYPKAEKIVAEWKQSRAVPQASWVCPHCKEPNEAPFTSCWKCGNERE